MCFVNAVLICFWFATGPDPVWYKKMYKHGWSGMKRNGCNSNPGGQTFFFCILLLPHTTIFSASYCHAYFLKRLKLLAYVKQHTPNGNWWLVDITEILNRSNCKNLTITFDLLPLNRQTVRKLWNLERWCGRCRRDDNFYISEEQLLHLHLSFETKLINSMINFGIFCY